MANHPASKVDDILAELRTQLDAHGEIGGPKIARLKWPHIPASSWCRYVKQAREEWTESLRLRQAGLPASSIAPTTAPAASASTDHPDGATPGVINWIAQIGAMLKQSDLITRQSIYVDPTTGVERVRNPVALQQAIRARTAILKLAADREAVQYGAERVAHWERAMIKEIFRAIGKVRTEDQRYLARRIRRAIELVSRRRSNEREVMGGEMAPRPETEPTEISNDQPE